LSHKSNCADSCFMSPFTHAPHHGTEVVVTAATSDDQDSFIPKRSERPAEPQMRFGIIVRADGDLNDGDIRFRMRHSQERIGAVIKSTLWVQVSRQSCGLDKGVSLARKFGRTRSRIADLVELFRETSKVILHRRSRTRHHREVVFLPVTRDHKNRFRLNRKLLRKTFQGGLKNDKVVAKWSCHVGPWSAAMG
jgi:hypothetical protein